MSSSRLENIRVGSVLVLVAAVLAFPSAFSFVVGSLLLIVGGILGFGLRPDGHRAN
ncbi:MAG TPA: hypothetical protein VE955_03590 [Candidatus Dormibacteraeota bacterium]|nr:hypothetical protein [Candidatus Dormibacteraeota bacterium]